MIPIAADPTVLAPLASPVLTGDPRSTTPATADNDTSIATTAFVKAQGYVASAALASYLPLTGGSLTGPGNLAVAGTLGVTGAHTGTTITTSGRIKASNVAIPAGGTLGEGLQFSTTANFGMHFGSGVPNKAMAKGSLYLRSDGTGTPYYNSDGTVGGWLQIGAGGGSATHVGTTPPSTPTDGQLWFYSDASIGGGQLYIYYNDRSAAAWVPASPGVGSGSVVQTVSYQTGAVATGTTIIPIDDTIPQISEGNEYMTLGDHAQERHVEAGHRGHVARLPAARTAVSSAWPCSRTRRPMRWLSTSHAAPAGAFVVDERIHAHDDQRHDSRRRPSGCGRAATRGHDDLQRQRRSAHVRRRHGLQHRHPGGAVMAAHRVPHRRAS